MHTSESVVNLLQDTLSVILIIAALAVKERLIKGIEGYFIYSF